MNSKGKNNNAIERFADWLIRWRWLVVIVSLIAIGAIGSGAKQIEMKNNYRVFFSKENLQLTSYENMQNIYTRDDNIMFVLSRPGEAVFSKDYLTAVKWLAEEVWKLEFVTRVDSVTNFQHSEAEEDDLIVGDLVEDPSALDEAGLARVERIAKAEPMIFNRLIGEKDYVIGINATLTLLDENATEPIIAAAAARGLVERFGEKFPGYDVHLTGMVMLNNAFAESSMRDMTSLFPLMYLGILITMAFLLRSLAGTLGTLMVIILSCVAAFGFMGFAGLPLTPPVATAPIIITTLAVADSIHILVTLLQQLRRGKSKRDAIVESMRLNFQPVLLTSVTTAIGFLSMNFSDAPPFRDLGNIVAVGVLAAWAISMTFLPAFLALLPLRQMKEKAAEWTWLDGFANFIILRRRVSLWGSVVVVTVLACFIPRINLDDRWVDYFAESIEFRTDTDFAVENLTGIYTLEYSIESGESGGISNPEYLTKLDEFTDWYRSQPETRQVVTLSDIMKRLNRNMHADDPEYYRVPESRELAAQYLLLFEMSLPYGLDLNNQINVDKSASRLIVSLGDLSTKELRGMIERAEVWQAANFPEEMRSVAASPSVMFAYISQRNIESMLTGTTLAVVLISFLLGLALRSVRYGLISVIPNFVPAILGFGAWGLFVGEMGMSLSVVTGMTLGIVVDDTVHFLTKYLLARREKGLTAEEAIRYAFHNVGRALVVTTIILVVGFSILSLSAFRLNSWMGQLTAIVITFALIADFIFFPALLLAFDRNKSQLNADAIPASAKPETKHETELENV